MTDIQLGPMERPETLADRVYLRLKRALIAGRLVPGQRLTIRSIADALAVSLTPAREALGRLVAERALEFGPNRSVFVPMLTQERLGELYQIRKLLEGFASETAALQLTGADVASLEQVQLELVTAMDRSDFEAVLVKNEEFHFGIYRAASMPAMLLIIESLWLQAGPYLNLLYPEYSDNRRGVSHHSEAIRAMRERDSSALRAAIEADLADGQKQLSAKLDTAIPEDRPPERVFG